MDTFQRESMQLRMRIRRASRVIDKLRSLGEGPRAIIRARACDAVGDHWLAEKRAGRPLPGFSKIRYGQAPRAG